MKTELLLETGQAVDYGQFPQSLNVKWYLSVLVGGNRCHCQNQTPPDHIDSVGSEILQE
jgi:hypothetical protein